MTSFGNRILKGNLNKSSETIVQFSVLRKKVFGQLDRNRSISVTKANGFGTFCIHYGIYWVGGCTNNDIVPQKAGKLNATELKVAIGKGAPLEKDLVKEYIFLSSKSVEGVYYSSEVDIGYKSPKVLRERDATTGSVPSTVPDALPQLRADPLTLRVLPDRTQQIPAAILGAFLMFSLGSSSLYARGKFHTPSTFKAIQVVKSSRNNRSYKVQEHGKVASKNSELDRSINFCVTLLIILGLFSNGSAHPYRNSINLGRPGFTVTSRKNNRRDPARNFFSVRSASHFR